MSTKEERRRMADAKKRDRERAAAERKRIAEAKKRERERAAEARKRR